MMKSVRINICYSVKQFFQEPVTQWIKMKILDTIGVSYFKIIWIFQHNGNVAWRNDQEKR